MDRNTIYVERESYNGYGGTDRGDFFATILVVSFMLFVIVLI